MELTPFGKQVRKYRIEAEVSLSEMAKALDVSSSYLSSIETGRKPLNDQLIASVIAFFRAKGIQADNLVALADRSKTAVRVDRLDDSARELVAYFARRLTELPQRQRAELEKRFTALFQGKDKKKDDPR